MTDPALLADRLDVSDVVSRYAFAVDHRDWPAFDAVFAPEVHLEVAPRGAREGRCSRARSSSGCCGRP